MYYVGLDIHQRSTNVEILDPNGKFFKRFEIRGPWPTLAPRLAAETPAPFAVCYEASCGYGYLHEQFSANSKERTKRDANVYARKKIPLPFASLLFGPFDLLQQGVMS